jgi:hypothetical protein
LKVNCGAILTDEMKLDVRWIADYRNGTHLSVQYCPCLNGLDPQTAESLQTPIMLRPFPQEVSGELRILAGLAASVMGAGPDAVEGRSWTLDPHVIERTITDTYIGKTSSYWLRFDYVFTHALGAHKREWREWRAAELPPETRSVVSRVDEFALRKAASHWAEHYNDFAKREDIKSSLPGPVNIFLSYRAESNAVSGLAKRIHDGLSAPGDATFFHVFLDKPDLGPGSWHDQLETALVRSDVFVPLLTSEYLGGNALWELEIAEAATAAGTLQIVPVLVEGGWKDHPRFNRLHGVQIPLEADDQILGVQLGTLRSLVVASAVSKRRE